MAHNIKIDDKTYDKLKAYCDLNSLSVHTVTKEAIEFYLNDIMYGDAPFLIADKLISEQQAAEEASKVLTKEDLENSGMTVLESVEHNENGDIEIHMKKLDGPDSVQAKYTVHNDGTVDTEKETPKRPTKRRL